MNLTSDLKRDKGMDIFHMGEGGWLKELRTLSIASLRFCIDYFPLHHDAKSWILKLVKTEFLKTMLTKTLVSLTLPLWKVSCAVSRVRMEGQGSHVIPMNWTSPLPTYRCQYSLPYYILVLELVVGLGLGGILPPSLGCPQELNWCRLGCHLKGVLLILSFG